MDVFKSKQNHCIACLSFSQTWGVFRPPNARAQTYTIYTDKRADGPLHLHTDIRSVNASHRTSTTSAREGSGEYRRSLYYPALPFHFCSKSDIILRQDQVLGQAEVLVYITQHLCTTSVHDYNWSLKIEHSQMQLRDLVALAYYYLVQPRNCNENLRHQILKSKV